jgi:hypothetical protein
MMIMMMVDDNAGSRFTYGMMMNEDDDDVY